MSSSSSSSFPAPPLANHAASRLEELWKSQLEGPWHRMDELERRMDENVMRKRRRIANLLEETSTHRRSHLRLFVTHHNSSSSNDSNPNSKQPEEASFEQQQQQQHKWELVIEGKLLVGHLDHQSAEQIEQEARQQMIQQQQLPTTKSSSSLTAMDVGDTGGGDSAAAALPTRSTDRTLYRGKNEQEGDVPVEPIHMTHFFDKLSVSFQTVYQPILQQRQPSLTPSKKSRSKSKAAAAATPAYLDDRHLTLGKNTAELTWTRPPAEGETPHFPITTATTSASSGDAHAWFVPYTTPPPPDQDKKVHSVIASIHLWPRPGPDKVYQASPALSAALFPQHSPFPTTPSSTSKKRKPKKKRRRSSPTPEAEEEHEEQQAPIPRQHDMYLPATLTLKEVVSALFFYIQQEKLQDDEEPSVIVNDTTLTSLFECERMNFADIQHLLLSKQLITDATQEPIVLTYVLTKDTVAPTLQQLACESSDEQEGEVIPPGMMSCDVDVYVPALFPYRAREIMRRIKRREFEYTSSRTKARNLMLRADENVCRTRIDECVVGRGLTQEHIPVWLALSKAAPAMSEARAAAQIEARTCLILDKLQEHCRAAQAAWDVVEACRGISADDSSSSEATNKKEEEGGEQKTS